MAAMARRHRSASASASALLRGRGRGRGSRGLSWSWYLVVVSVVSLVIFALLPLPGSCASLSDASEKSPLENNPSSSSSSSALNLKAAENDAALSAGKHAHVSPSSSLNLKAAENDAALSAGKHAHVSPSSSKPQLNKAAGNVAPVNALVFMTVLMLLTVILTRHGTRKRWLTEASVACLLGLFAGNAVLVYYRRTSKVPETALTFDDDLFFDICLPPIIFQAGFSVRKRRFFRNAFDIFLLGGLGTMCTFAMISTGAWLILPKVVETAFEEAKHTTVHFQLSDALAMGAVFAATDSVATLQVLDGNKYPLLFSLVFGEGIVNDATSIVLLSSIRHVHRVASKEAAAISVATIAARFFYLLFASLGLGVAIGLLSAIILKSIYQQKFKYGGQQSLFSPDHEVALVALLGFLAYVLAEALGLSAIFAVFFAALTMSHYTWFSLSEQAQFVAANLFRLVSSIMELFIFVYVGFTTWDVSLWRHTNMQLALGLTGAILALISASRVAMVLPVCFTANCYRSEPLRFREILAIAFSGIHRGAVSTALVFHYYSESDRDTRNPTHAAVISSTLLVVLTSTVLIGGVTKPMLSCLLDGDNENDQGVADEPASPTGYLEHGQDEPLLGTVLTSGQDVDAQGYFAPNTIAHSMYKRWSRMDARYLQPIFGGKYFRHSITTTSVDGGTGETTSTAFAALNGLHSAGSISRRQVQ